MRPCTASVVLQIALVSDTAVAAAGAAAGYPLAARCVNQSTIVDDTAINHARCSSPTHAVASETAAPACSQLQVYDRVGGPGASCGVAMAGITSSLSWPYIFAYIELAVSSAVCVFALIYHFSKPDLRKRELVHHILTEEGMAREQEEAEAAQRRARSAGGGAALGLGAAKGGSDVRGPAKTPKFVGGQDRRRASQASTNRVHFADEAGSTGYGSPARRVGSRSGSRAGSRGGMRKARRTSNTSIASATSSSKWVPVHSRRPDPDRASSRGGGERMMLKVAIP